jgi:hypothetical protein
VRSWGPLRGEVEALLSTVAWAGSGGDPSAARAAFDAGVRRLPGDVGAVRLLDAVAVDLPRVDKALDALEHAAPAIQRRFLDACAAAAAQDRHMQRREAELLRAISEALDCPMPPVLEAE